MQKIRHKKAIVNLFFSSFLVYFLFKLSKMKMVSLLLDNAKITIHLNSQTL
jgi:hypothetical protein